MYSSVTATIQAGITPLTNVPHRCGETGISREDGRKKEQRIPFSQSLTPTRTVSPQSCIGCLHCSITKEDRFIWRENWLSPSTIMTQAGYREARIQDSAEHKLSMHRKHVQVYSNWDFYAVCTVIVFSAWLKSETGNCPRERYSGCNWKCVDIWWTAVHCAQTAKYHNWTNRSLGLFSYLAIYWAFPLMTTRDCNFLPVMLKQKLEILWHHLFWLPLQSK